VISSLEAAIAAETRLAAAFDALEQALATQDPARAAACAQHAAVCYRLNGRALLALGDTYVGVRAIPQAVQAWVTSARLVPFNPVPVARLAVLARSLGQPEASAKLAELAIKRAPK